jgi:isopenicillin-N epimerase
VGNTTTGVNTILKAFQFDPEDVLLCTSHIYSAVLNTADSVVTKANADLLSIDIPGTIKTEDEIINLFEQVVVLKFSRCCCVNTNFGL